MSGFGIRAFKRLKEESLHKDDSRKFFTHIVVGNSTLAIARYLKLRKDHGEGQVALITDTMIDRDSLEHEWRCSMHMIRSEELVRKLQGKAPELELTPVKSETLFYKDTKFHPFGGRAKPMNLLEGEELFQNTYYKAQWRNLFSDQDWENLDEILKSQFHKFLDEIEIDGPKDLVEKTHYKLHTGEMECFECEKLHWFMSPKKFVNLINNKDNLPEEVKAYGAGVEEKPAVVVSFESKGQVYDSEGTVYLPQSMTHEWGHFIFDFDKYDPQANTQPFKVLILLHDDEVTSEELAKRIKLMKRVLARIMPDFSKFDYTEYIRYDEHMFIFGENKKFEHVEFIHTLE